MVEYCTRCSRPIITNGHLVGIEDGDPGYCWTDGVPAVYDVEDYACLLTTIANLKEEVNRLKQELAVSVPVRRKFHP